MKRLLAPAFVVGVAVLAGVVSYRLSTDALALIVGVLLGLLIMAPLAALVAWVLRGQQRAGVPAAPPPVQPAVIILQPPASSASTPYWAPPAPDPAQGLPPPAISQPRNWTLRVFGDQDEPG